MALAPTTTSSSVPVSVSPPTTSTSSSSPSAAVTTAPSVSVLPVDAVVSQVLQALLQRIGSLPSTSGLSRAGVSPAPVVTATSVAVNCKFVKNNIRMLLWCAYSYHLALLMWRFYVLSHVGPAGSTAFKASKPFQLTADASVRLLLGGGVFHCCCSGVRAPRQWRFYTS